MTYYCPFLFVDFFFSSSGNRTSHILLMSPPVAFTAPVRNMACAFLLLIGSLMAFELVSCPRMFAYSGQSKRKWYSSSMIGCMANGRAWSNETFSGVVQLSQHRFEISFRLIPYRPVSIFSLCELVRKSATRLAWFGKHSFKYGSTTRRLLMVL